MKLDSARDPFEIDVVLRRDLRLEGAKLLIQRVTHGAGLLEGPAASPRLPCRVGNAHKSEG